MSGFGRMRERREFTEAASKGRKASAPGVVVQSHDRGDGGAARLGFTATKKLGGAVVRNRAKRRLREALREALGCREASGLNVVAIGREGTLTRPFRGLVADVGNALDRCGVTRRSDSGVRGMPR